MKVTKKIVFEVACRDLEDFVQEHYGREFNIALDQELGNDTSQSFAVDGIFKHPASLELVAAFKAEGQRSCGGQWLAKHLLNDLAAKGLIEKGDYIVRICW